MNYILVIILIISGLLVAIILYVINNEKKTIKNLKEGFINFDVNYLINNLHKFESVSGNKIIGDKNYIIVKTKTLRTLKIFEFNDENICTSFFVQTLEIFSSLPINLNYESNFEILDNDNFEEGIDTSIVFREPNPTFFHNNNNNNNGLTIKINNNRYAKVFKHIPKYSSIKYSPMFIYSVGTTKESINELLSIVKEEFMDELSEFNSDRLEISLL